MGLSDVVLLRSLATHLAGSQYCTRGSLSPVVTNSAGYGCAVTLSYGEYDFMRAYAAGSRGSPHSSHSVTVSGSSGSSIVVTTSTNGTSATIAAKRSGRRLATAPINKPPALPPRATSRSGVV